MTLESSGTRLSPFSSPFPPLSLCIWFSPLCDISVLVYIDVSQNTFTRLRLENDYGSNVRAVHIFTVMTKTLLVNVCGWIWDLWCRTAAVFAPSPIAASPHQAHLELENVSNRTIDPLRAGICDDSHSHWAFRGVSHVEVVTFDRK